VREDAPPVKWIPMCWEPWAGNWAALASSLWPRPGMRTRLVDSAGHDGEGAGLRLNLGSGAGAKTGDRGGCVCDFRRAFGRTCGNARRGRQCLAGG